MSLLGRRSAWVEIDQRQLRKNFAAIAAHKPDNLKILSVVKDQAYGHGAVLVAKEAERIGVSYFAVETTDEAIELRSAGITTPIMLFGEASQAELEVCLAYDLTCFVNDIEQAQYCQKLAQSKQQTLKIQTEIDTGMSRWGVRWTQASALITQLQHYPNLYWEGVMSHFAMSDESDKRFANLQHARFTEVLAELAHDNIAVPLKHMCNTGGYLDLPHAHFDMVRVGILPLGVYPSLVCNQIDGIMPVMSVKAQIMAVRALTPGDSVGYGMHFVADKPMRIAVIPIGYGDGYPRQRNQAEVLIHGQRCRQVGGNAMDAMMVDITHLPQAQLGDEVVLMGQQNEAYIDPRELVQWKQTVCYEILANWRARLPRRIVNPIEEE